MLPRIQEYLDQLLEPQPYFSLQNVVGFPYSEYNSNLTRYSELETWYTGEALDETVERQGKEIELYPVKVNPIPRTVEQHTYFLFGQVKQDDRPLVYPKVVPNNFSDSSQVESAKQLEDILYRAWAESNGRAVQWQAGAQSQLYGGLIFRLVYDPLDPLRTIPIRIESIHPKSFVGVPDGRDIWRIRECWIVRAINHEEAKEHGVVISEDEQPWLVEHITNKTIEVTINGNPASRQLPDGSWIALSGENVWGFVPVVYIPHIRVYGFYGETFIDNVQGIVKELNLRLADFGDAITADAHRYLGMRNVSGAPTIQQLAPALYAVNLHSNPMMTGQEQEPDLFELGASRASDPMKVIIDLLYLIYRRLVAVPSVAEGEDEGSQRSGLTLVTRMISLISHTDSERIFWTTGLNLLTRMLIKMLLMLPESNRRDIGIKPEHLLFPVRQEWAPVLPRDREQTVQEVVALMGAKLGSIERLLDLLGVDNPSEERELIMKDVEELLEAEAEAQAKANPQPEAQGMKGSSSEAAKGTPAREKKQKAEDKE